MKKYIYVKSENQTNLKYKTKIIQNMLNLQLKNDMLDLNLKQI